MLNKFRKAVSLARNLTHQLFMHRKKAVNYIQQFGAKNFILKSIQIASSGGLAYYEGTTSAFKSKNTYFKIQPEVILVSNDINSPSHEYRVANFSQALWEIGVPNYIFTVSDILSLEQLPRRTNLVYFWRTNLNLLNLNWYKQAILDGVTIAYDSDDLTFEKITYNRDNVNALNFIPNKEANYLIDEIAQSQQIQVEQSTLGIACTLELANAFKRLGKNSVRIPIVLPRWLEQQGNFLFQNKLPMEAKKGINIIYCSGSRSHTLDFKAAEQGIFKFLSENLDSTFTIQGATPISPKEIPEKIKRQVNFHPMLPHRELLEYLSAFDVQIAPLEIGNPFVEAKSATKFMQGGIVGVPTVASPTQAFRDCIQDGENGLLASNSEEWFHALTLLKNVDFRMKISSQARQSTLEKHCIGAIIEDVKKLVASTRTKVFSSRIQFFATPHKISNIVWLLPSYIFGSGGHRNVYRIANLIEGNEFHSQIYFHDDTREASSISTLIEKNYCEMNFEVISNKSQIKNADFVVSVHNSSVPFAKLNAGNRSKLVYLVQDFEPWFTPMGVHSLEALSTYFDPDLNIITSGGWMARKIEEIKGIKPPFFNFPVDTSIYNLNNAEHREGVIFFAKSDTPRRLFELGLEVLEILSSQNPRMRITIFGSDHESYLNFKHQNLKLIPTLDELAKVYSNHKVGIAFSPTNPSLVPYEMMACGLPVLDVDIPGAPMEKYGSSEFLTPSIYGLEHLISRANKLLGDEEYWKNTSEAGINFVKTMPTPKEASDVVLGFFRKLSKESS
jgi:glycosyltransferase involved in cell wall biosynthesis